MHKTENGEQQKNVSSFNAQRANNKQSATQRATCKHTHTHTHNTDRSPISMLVGHRSHDLLARRHNEYRHNNGRTEFADPGNTLRENSTSKAQYSSVHYQNHNTITNAKVCPQHNDVHDHQSSIAHTVGSTMIAF